MSTPWYCHPPYYIKKAEYLRNDTNVGKFIKFNYGDSAEEFYLKPVMGIVKAKYKYTFMLDNGKVYRWIDYLIGYIY